MSQATNLQQLMLQVSSTARGTSQQVASLKPKMAATIAQVESAVGGSAQRIDVNLIAALQEADKQLAYTIGILAEVAKQASLYAARI